MAAAYSRRDFLRLSSLAVIGPALRSGSARPARHPLGYGRVIFIYATIYRRPSIFTATSIIHELETVLPIYGEEASEDSPPNNKRWYETEEGYVYSTNVQPVQNRPTQPQVVLAPQLGEVTIPFVDALNQPQAGSSIAYRFYYSSTHWVQRSVTDVSGDIWYQLLNDRADRSYFVPGLAIRLLPPAELLPLSPTVSDKRIQIDTTAERITALENGRPVFTTRISSGGNFGEGKDFRTPLGNYRIDRKRPSRHMAAGDGVADDAYDLPGVPWVSYFNGGIALHGTYWHNDFGHPWSHGCINMLSQDAKWFYRWTTPTVALNETLVEASGTPITVV